MINKLLTKHIDESLSGKTVKEILKYDLKLSNRIINKIKGINGIKINNQNVFVNFVTKANDILELLIDDDFSEHIIPEKMNIDIIYEDDNILAVNKPPGLVVHPTTYHFTGTLANGIMYYFKEANISSKFRPVNRLDRDTSGIVLIAKSQLSHSILSNQLIKNEFKKEYIAIVHNNFENQNGIINAPIARKPGSMIERYIHESGQSAVTYYSVLSQSNNATLVKIGLQTGRTHQIRVHFNYIGHSLFGDTLYGGDNSIIQRQALHCLKINFTHPINRRNVCILCDVPDDMRSLARYLNLDLLL